LSQNGYVFCYVLRYVFCDVFCEVFCYEFCAVFCDVFCGVCFGTFMVFCILLPALQYALRCVSAMHPATCAAGRSAERILSAGR
jgi:hypothetical protein